MIVKGNGLNKPLEQPCNIHDVSTRTYSQDDVNELLEKIANKFQNRKLYGTSVGGCGRLPFQNAIVVMRGRNIQVTT